jgi:sugar phosphate isomerase/epimerase
LTGTDHQWALGTHLTLWGGNVENLSLQDRFEAAHAGGFTSMSVSPLDVHRWREDGLSFQQLRGAAAAAGVRISGVEPITQWLGSWEPTPSMSAETVAFGNFQTDTVLSVARELGAELVTATEYTSRAVDLESATECFGSLCDTALTCGVRIALEPMPFSGIPDLGLAWEIVRGAARANGGLALDSWHQFRASRPTADLDLIAQLPGDRVFAVHLDDAPAEPRGDDLRYETNHWRLPPGEGELDLKRFVAQIRATGARAAIGPEVFCDDLVSLSPTELGRRLRETTNPYVH